MASWSAAIVAAVRIGARQCVRTYAPPIHRRLAWLDALAQPGATVMRGKCPQ
eukprot:NODE_28657_length_470_cov_6.921283.p4 GENE.NODE_28657_length_470_cov_6.921283~~NODE_28657_length_470_cov_6.921283.p4  ORF type:complete len:52 (+),score=2.93 NODE_28657_length_470_cov_6.921283:136-291(+)